MQIAIIGMSGLFPGSSTLDQFWKNLMEEKDLTALAEATDFGVDPGFFFQAGKGVVDKCYSLRGGYIRDFKFDPNGYALPADFLARQDKLFQWTLQTSREALSAGGYIREKEKLEKCGLVLGNLSFPTSHSHRILASVYTQTLEKALQKLLREKDFQLKARRSALPESEVLNYTPTQMAREALGLGATHYALDAACASSLYAIKLACDELISGKADMMLAGAVCASDQLFIHMGFSIFHAYAEADKKFVPLDKNSSGLVSSEGAGIAVLKRLEDAQRDGDDILAVIRSVGLSNDGSGRFLLSPNPKGQKLAFERAYAVEDVQPQNTYYLECHATGTPLGDITELNSIAEFYKDHQTRPLLGSVKSNMGHLLTAAGMAGLFKVVLAMQKNQIPPNIHLKDALRSDNGWTGREQMILKTVQWTEAEKQAGINAFGFGGTNAHMVVQNKREQDLLKADSPFELTDMSIIGMDVHFGDCASLTDFYHSIFYGRQHFKPLPKTRWKGFEANEALLKSFGFADGKAPRGAYIEDFEIDLLRYKIQPKETETLEPQQGLILKVADRAIQDAGLEKGQNVAVLIAMEAELGIHQYLARWDAGWQIEEALEKYEIELDAARKNELLRLSKNSLFFREGSQTPGQHTSFVGNIMASRIAALWDFSGPAFTVSCGENSVFKALEIARNMLSAKEVEAVVVGAVDFAGGLEHVLLRNQKDKINAAAKPSLSFNIDDGGWTPGEGAGAVVLKRRDRAEASRIYVHIDGLGKNVLNSDIDYLELSASGIADQDAEEEAALRDKAKKWSAPLALGSVKANIGHTFAASGIAALIKTTLCLRHRFIPGIPNWKEPKNKSVFENTPYYFPAESRPWVRREGRAQRRAAINGVGALQLRLTEALPSRAENHSFLLENMPKLFLLKGASQIDLSQQLSALEIALEDSSSLAEINRLFYDQFLVKESAYCLVLAADDKKSLKREIHFFKTTLKSAFQNRQSLKTPGGSYFTPNPLGKKGKLAFVYPGSSTAYTGLGKNIFQLFPQLYDHYKDLKPGLGVYLNPQYLYPKTLGNQDDLPNIYEDAIAMMAAGVFFSATYTHVLRSFFKLEPDIAFGYSMGECSSMWYSLGVWSPDETKEFMESPIFQDRFAGRLETLASHWQISSEEAKESWTSLVLLAQREKVEALTKHYKRVYLTFVNTEEEVVLSGDKTACMAVVEQLNCPYVQIPFQNVIHHEFCLMEEEGLIKMHRFPLQGQPDIDFYSSITQTKIPFDSRQIAENSTRVCAEKVDFPKSVQNVYQAGARIFVELGANATCTNWIKTILKDRTHLAVSISQKGKTDERSLAELLAQLISHGVDLDLSILYPDQKEQNKKRSFLKKIVPGGPRIYDTLSTETLKRRFADVSKKTTLIKEKKLALVSAERSLSSVDHFIHHSEYKAIPKMEIKEMEADKTKNSERAEKAENGLALQNFESGEHLKGKEIIFSQEDLEEFAKGKIANVFGSEYALIDTYSRRVMLPMQPYLLVSRVTGLKAKLGEYKPSFMQTEYDIPYDAWFTTDRQIPWAVSVESGQCDLLLISYIGIDFQNKGNLVYRLLDCTLTFVDDLPYEGQTLRYDISINSFVRNQENLLFFFSYRCYVADRLVLKMDGGCAGFFSDDQLSEGKGVIYSDSELEAREKAVKQHFTPLLNTQKRAFTKEDLQHLIRGDIEKCFEDESYFANGRNPSLRLPPEKILMLDRIVSADLKGGAYGLGYIVAEKDLHPDDWYFPCHFRDDEVLAGSLQAEGGGNLLRFFMLMLGLQRLVKDARFQPVFDLPQKVRCRKEVTPKDTKLVYKLEIKEIGLIPNPYIIGDLEIISNEVVTVHFENLGLQLREKTNPRYLEETPGIPVSARSANALMDEKTIATFALGKLSDCFGPEYAIYDDRTVSRQPNTDLQLISRVLKIDGKRGDFSKPATIFAEYDVPTDAWYYRQNANASMPYAILMEIALQPCGLMGAYLGSTLQFPDQSLYFRNLDGEGELLDWLSGTDFRGKTIHNKAVLLSSVALGGTVLQNYSFELSIDGRPFYRGKSSFGFFPAEMLADQVGLDNGKRIASWYRQKQLTPRDYMQIKLDSLYGKMKLYKAPDDKPHYRLASDQLNLLDRLIVVKKGGKYDQGYIHALRKIRTYDWFFTCHFYEDPVMPGSLGVEAMLQAVQVFALQQDLGKDFKSPKFVQTHRHKTIWKYRGQILGHVREMELEVHIKKIESNESRLTILADASLWNDEVRIYEATDLALSIEEAGL